MALYKRHGRINQHMIDEAPDLPSHQKFARIFGSLSLAYECAGIPRTKPYLYARTKQVLKIEQLRLKEDVYAAVIEAGGTIEQRREGRVHILNGGITLGTIVARCRHVGPYRYWKPFSFEGCDGGFTIVARLDEEKIGVLDYFLLPTAITDQEAWVHKGQDDKRWDAFRYPNTRSMFGLT